MGDLKTLEFKKLIKELEFVELDYKFQSEVIGQNESTFLTSVKVVVSKFPKLEELIVEKENILPHHNTPSEKIEKIENSKLKKLYREIAKHTHPDKIKNFKLNSLYIESSKAYESDDIITIYRICLDLGIEFSWGEEEILKIKEKISDLKLKINILESSYTYRWIMSNNKNEIILEYLKNKLN